MDKIRVRVVIWHGCAASSGHLRAVQYLLNFSIAGELLLWILGCPEGDGNATRQLTGLIFPLKLAFFGGLTSLYHRADVIRKIMPRFRDSFRLVIE
jgi:hypothetical protein